MSTTLLAAAWLAPSALATAVTRPAGVLELDVNGVTAVVPTLKTDVDARVDGDLATVHLVQTFENPTDAATHARYVFPLPEDAAVYAMTMRTASGEIVAEIHRREEAKVLFDAAKAEGKKAALLDQERPNVFTQQVANLGPHEKVQIELSYAHPIERLDGTWTFHLPLVVGPRYVPAEGGDAPSPTGTWTVKSTDTLPNPAHVDPGRVSVTLHVAPGRPLSAPIGSTTHPLHVASGPAGEVTATLADGRVLDNRDLVVTWRTATEQSAVATAVSAEGGRGVVELLIEPPAAPPPEQLAPRELVFVLDTSCSMEGFPLDTSRALMKKALVGLRPTDRFRLVKFDTMTSEFAVAPMPPDGETLARAVAWIDNLQAGGGTDVEAGLERAFVAPPVDDAVRLVVLVTDGYIGNEDQVTTRLAAIRGDARVFSLGIGSSVNRYLVEEVARAGRGSARIVLGPTDAPEAAEALMERLAAPVLTDVRLDWGGAPVREVTPAVLPDLVAGSPIRVLAKFDGTGTFPVTVRGKLAGADAALAVPVTLPESAPGRDALGHTWARTSIDDLSHARLAPSATPAERDALQEQITVLGLEYGLVTPWTSFVAVSKVDPALVAQAPIGTGDVETPIPAGVSPTAYPSGGASFGGSAAPEPAAWLAGALALTLGAAATRRRKASRR